MLLIIYDKNAAAFCTIKSLGIIITVFSNDMILPFVEPYAHQINRKTTLFSYYRIVGKFHKYKEGIYSNDRDRFLH